MQKRSLLLLAACLLLFSFLGTGYPQERDRFTYWKAEFPGGTYVVAHSAITSISMSTYIVDAVLRVTEVTVGTTGSVQGRFYFFEENAPSSPAGVGQSALEDLKARAREVLERTPSIHAEGEVVKNYPTTTHAHTVEFRLAKRVDVEKLYQSLENSFLNRQTMTFRP